jgi:hypothetical protein
VAAETTVRALVIVTGIVSVALAVATTALAWLNRDTPVPESLYMGSKVDVTSPLFTLVFVATGALIALRQPRHPVGWSFILLGLFADLFLALVNYRLYATLTAPGSLPAAGLAVWITHWFWAMPSAVLPIMLLLFPTGRPPTARWWPVAWLAVGATLLFALTDALGAYLATGESSFGTLMTPGPLGLASLVSALLWAATLVAAVASLVVRFRRSNGVERQQLKWFASAGAVVVFFQLIGLAVYVAPVPPVISVLTGLSYALLPLSAAVAILRYRLYDIDVVIERTLVYGVVTATLGATYVATVVVLQGLLRPLTEGSEIAVALSTLLVVALFQPIRRRAQDAVDRRFYRARYDGSRTVDAFIARLRNDVELDSVRADLLDVVNATIQPAHASVWLRRSGR